MLLFVRELSRNSKVTANLALATYLILLAVFLLLYRFDILHLSSLLPFIHICTLVIVIFSSILLLREYLLTKKQMLIGPGIAFLILCIAVATNVDRRGEQQGKAGEQIAHRRVAREELVETAIRKKPDTAVYSKQCQERNGSAVAVNFVVVEQTAINHQDKSHKCRDGAFC